MNFYSISNWNSFIIPQLILLGFVALAAADVKHLTDRNLDLFKYNPSDIYTLPEDIDDDKPAVHFSGDVMKAKTEELTNYNSGKKFKLQWVFIFKKLDT